MGRSMRRWWRMVLAAALALMTLGALRPAPAAAASFVVTNTANAGTGSLRQALLNAGASPGADTIAFALPGAGPWTINLASQLPPVNQALTIQGPGADRLTIRPLPTLTPTVRFPLLEVNVPGQPVVLSGLTLSGGRAATGYGGNLRSISGDLTLLDMTLRAGTAAGCQGGAGAYVSNGTVQIIRTTISGNVAPGCAGRYAAGAGLYVDEAYGGVDLTIAGGAIVGNTATGGTGSAGGGLAIERISGVPERRLTAWLQSVVIGSAESPNRATAYGGGIVLKGATVTLADSVVMYNVGAGGAGIAAVGGALRLERSYVGYNRATGLGGGIHVSSVATTLVDTTLVGNRALAADSGEGINYGQGGGLYNELGSVEIRGGTILSNTAAIGGGIMNNNYGGMFISGTAITHNNSTVSNGRYFDGGGGGIMNNNSSLTAANSTIANNTATLYGGGISTLGYLSTTVTNSAITGNSARAGGGIKGNNGTLTVTNSTIANNRAEQGGGVSNEGATFTVTGSTISGNVAGSYGGAGITHFGAGRPPLVVTNSTISDNSSVVGAGGFDIVSGSLTLVNATVTGNSAPRAGVWINGPIPGHPIGLTLRGSVVAGNNGADCAWTAGVVATSQGYNVVGQGGGCPSSGPGDLAYGGPLASLLNPTLASNGGPTQTHALPPGSPAINRIPTAQCAVADDQRGVARPQGAGCDSGAYEAP